MFWEFLRVEDPICLPILKPRYFRKIFFPNRIVFLKRNTYLSGQINLNVRPVYHI